MPPKASSASSPCSAAPTQYSTMPTQPRLSSTPRPLILLLPRRTERNTRPGEPGAREQVGPTVTRKDACPCRRSAKRRPPRFGTEWKTHRARREGNWAGQAPPLSRARAGLASPPKPRCGVPSRSRPAQGLALCCVRRTPGISCEAVPAPNWHERAQGGTSARRTGADLSFVSFIPLFGSPPDPRACA